jgi:hypothetical protein
MSSSVAATHSYPASILFQGNPDSMQGMLRDLVNTVEFSLLNSNHQVNYTEKNKDYELEISDLHIDNVLVNNARIIFENEGEFDIVLAGMNTYGKVDGNIKAKYDVPLN